MPIDTLHRSLRQVAFAILAGVLLLLGACSLPVQVHRISPTAAQREATSNVISTGNLSDDTRIFLHLQDMTDYYKADPEQAIARLHGLVAAGGTDPNVLFALAEMSYQHARRTGKRSYYLAAAVYAFAFLFPDDPAQRVSPFDRRFRTACDIYNRGLASGLASADRLSVDLRSGRYELPFGSIDIVFDADSARWGDRNLVGFTPTDNLGVSGLDNNYRRDGIGAPLAASTTAVAQQTGFPVAPLMRAPVTALLNIDLSRDAVGTGKLHGTLTVYPAFNPSVVEVRGESVPLAVDTTAALAYSLSDPRIWSSELAGFRRSDLFDRGRRPQLVGIEPYQPGKIPVVFIHGTASSAGRWGNLINDLQADPMIHDHFQFWMFSYATGNPTPFSALQLRNAIENGLHRVDPQGKDPALHDIVLIGHSQGGLLAKLLVIDSGSRLWDAFSNRPLDELNVSAQTRDLIRRALFVKPLPAVKRVIFIATPQHGSFVAGGTIGQLAARLVSLPLAITRAFGEIITGNPGASRWQAGSIRLSSVWSMSPRNPALQALAAIPVAPGVAAHSIIAVQGDGPVATGNDGVVSYKSAHIPEAVSELVVRSGHSVQGNPHTVAEVRRILLLHLAQTCPSGCAPISASGRVASAAVRAGKPVAGAGLRRSGW